MGNLSTERPWDDLPPAVAQVLRPELPGLAEEMIEALREGVPDYARPLDGPFGDGLRIGVESALGQFVEMIENPGRARQGRDVYVNLGRAEMRSGRGLDVLLAAYRLGARVAWRRISAAGVRAGFAPETLYVLAEAIFAYIDELSADSAEGYAQEQSAAAGEAQRTRYRLVELLLQQPAAEAASIEAVAAELGWRLPRSLAVACADGAEPEELAPRLPVGTVAVRLQDVVLLVLPDPDTPVRRAQIDRAAGGLSFAVGPTVAWRNAAVSYARASAALELVREGILPRGTVVRAREHVSELLLTRDRGLAQELVADRLAPLADLPPAARLRLAETLLAWLSHQGRLQPVAKALHVHPQTVRYRLAQLKERFGDVLDEPEGRFELELALRAERLAGSI
jgi:hypothetical protein